MTLCDNMSHIEISKSTSFTWRVQPAPTGKAKLRRKEPDASITMPARLVVLRNNDEISSHPPLTPRHLTIPHQRRADDSPHILARC